MDEYSRLLEKIKSYFLMDDVKDDSDVISVYTLYKILQEQFSELKIIGKLQKKINRIGGIIKLNKCNYDIIIFSSNKIRICEQFNYHNSFSILQDKDSKELYLEGNNIQRNLVSRYYNDFLKIFECLENMSNLVGTDCNVCNQIIQKFGDLFFDGYISVNFYGKVSFVLSVADKNSKDLIERNWCSRKKLLDYIYDNFEIILKKIPVEIDALNPSIRNVLRSQIKSKQKILS